MRHHGRRRGEPSARPLEKTQFGSNEMAGLEIHRRIKYQEELDLDFADQVAAMPGAADLKRCIQCGTCSATCPVSLYMDLTPRRVVAMTRAGFKKEVLESNTIWLCASCYSCTVECPKGIKITDIMYALKRLAIQEGAYPKRFPTPVLARELSARSGPRPQQRGADRHGDDPQNESAETAQTNPSRAEAAVAGPDVVMDGKDERRSTPAPKLVGSRGQTTPERRAERDGLDPISRG